MARYDLTDFEWFAIEPLLPQKSRGVHKHRNLVERFFYKIKYLRRLARRYDKLGSSFLAMLKLAAIRLCLRHSESTA